MKRPDRYAGAAVDERLHAASHFARSPVGERNRQDATGLYVTLKNAICNAARDDPSLSATRARGHHERWTVVLHGTPLIGIQIVEQCCHGSVREDVLLPSWMDNFSKQCPYPTI
jgi:hypothetical protein